VRAFDAPPFLLGVNGAVSVRVESDTNMKNSESWGIRAQAERLAWIARA
jgi:hypothetical protein